MTKAVLGLGGVAMLKPTEHFFKVLFIFVFLFVSSNGFAANYPLEVLQPQENLNIKNRFYKAYPRLEYNVRMAVTGGKFPYTYTLTNAPPGMEIDPRSGEISWPSPVESSSPYRVSATVTDSENEKKSVSWTILVTKEGFIFVDAVNGKSAKNGGTGTISDPWLSLKDVYGGDTADDQYKVFHRGDFVYWRAGTYKMDAYLADAGGDGLRVGFTNDRKAQVWLAYPGDAKPVMQQDTAYLYFAGSGRDVYLDGIDFRSDGNARAIGLTIASAKDNVVVRRSEFSGITGGSQGGNNALIFIRKWGLGHNYAIQDNNFRDVDVGYGILNYNTRNVLIEDNHFRNIGDHPVGMKVRSERWEVRGNRFVDNPRNSIELHYNNLDSSSFSGDVEIRFNVVELGGGRLNVNQSYQDIGFPVYIHRNTLMDNAEQKYVTEFNGPFHWEHNVIINESESRSNIDLVRLKYADRLIIKDNLTGSLADGIVDSNGNLTSKYAEFIGTMGHQLGNPPSAISLKLDR